MEPKKKLLIGAAIGAGLTLLYGPALLRWVELQAHREQLRAEVAYLQRENLRLYQETKLLREDPDYAEAFARREYGLVRPGETVVKFKKSETGSKTRR